MEKEKSPFTDGFIERYDTFLNHFGLNPNKLAAELGDSHSRVKYGHYRNGKVLPGYDTLVKISEKYGVSLDWFMLGKGSMLLKQNPGISRAEELEREKQELARKLEKAQRELDEAREIQRRFLMRMLKEETAGLPDFLKAIGYPTTGAQATRRQIGFEIRTDYGFSASALPNPCVRWRAGRSR